MKKPATLSSERGGLARRRAYAGCALAVIAAGLAGWYWHRARQSAPASGALPAAEQRLLAAVARQPESAAAHAALGQYYLQAGQSFEAIWALEQAEALAPGDRETKIDLATAFALARLYPEAEAQLQAAVGLPPAARDGRRELAALDLATGRPEPAIAVLHAAPGLDQWYEGQLLLGRAEEGLGRTTAARRAYERAAQLAPDRSEGPFRTAYLLLASGDPLGARAVLERALRRWPQEARLQQLLAMTYSGRWGQREEPDVEGQLLSNALRAGGTVPAHLALGALYLRHGRFREAGGQLAPLAEQTSLPAAHRAWAAVLAALSQETEACYQRGMADVFEGSIEAGLREFRAMEARAPRDPRVPQLISQCYAQMKQLNTALKSIEGFYRQGDRSPELYERLATLYLLTYDRRAGRRFCEEWRRAQPNNGQPLAHLGQIDLDDLHLAGAVRDYEGAIARDPKNAADRLGLANALLQQPSPENSRRALTLLREAVALAPHDAAARYQLGARLQQARLWEEARRQFLRALDESPTMAPADNNLVQVAIALRQPALAQRFAALAQAVQARQREEDAAWQRRWDRPHDAQAYTALALIQARAGDLENAERQLQRATALRPGWPATVGLQERVRRLLDGADSDGRRLVQFPAAAGGVQPRRDAAQ